MSSPHLCTTALTEFWDRRAEKILFLGSWCLRYDQQNDWRDLNYEILPHPWDDRDVMHQAAIYEEEVYEELLQVLGEFLDEAHEEKHSKHYWRIILGPWLLHYVQVLHERYLCIVRALDRYPDLDTIGLAESSFRIPRHFLDHLVGSTGDVYNLQLYTSVIQAMLHQVPVRDFCWLWDERVGSKAGPFLRRALRKLRPFWRVLGPYWARKASVIMVDMYIPVKQIIQLMVRTGFKARWCDLPYSEKWVDGASEQNPDPCRSNLGQLVLESNDPFRSVLMKTLPAHFPLIYLERYRACRRWVKRTWHGSDIRSVVTSNALLGNETFRFLAAHVKERGSKLIAIQHGATYGTARHNPFEGYETSTADEFWSWGWDEERGSSVRPMPNPKLSHLAAQRELIAKSGKHYIFFVGNVVPRYHYRTVSWPIADQGKQYLEWQIRFLRKLKADIRTHLRFRPYPHDYGWCLRQRLSEACPDLIMDHPHDDYYTQLLEASLVVCDMNQTTLLESIAANIPTIAFWDHRLWELRAEAEPYFQAMREVGILYHSPERAAESVNELWPEVDDWWVSPKRQDVVRLFSVRFALNSSNWAAQWASALKDLARSDNNKPLLSRTGAGH